MERIKTIAKQLSILEIWKERRSVYKSRAVAVLSQSVGEKKWFTSDLDGLKSIIVDDVTYDISGKSNWKISFVYKDAKNKKEPTAILLTSKSRL